MFERYTEKARRVIFFARYEASQFGSTCIESEHLVLGLLREDKVLASQFLPSTSIESVRRQIEAQTTMRDKVPTSVDLPLSDESKRILIFGAEERERLNQENIGTGHLFLGVLREENCFGAQLLRGHGVKLDRVREWVAHPDPQPAVHPGVYLEAHGRFVGPRGLDLDRYSLKALTAVLHARTEASQFACSAIEAEHLLLGLLRTDQAIRKRLLPSEGVVESIRKRIESNIVQPPQERNTPKDEVANLRLRIKVIVTQMENAIGQHQFEKARRCSNEERKLREELRLLLEKNDLSDSSAEELQLSEQCQRVLNQGAEEATLLKQRYIGTEHLLLGILREEKSFAADILHESGLQLAQTREEIARWSQEQGGDHV